MNNQEVWKDVKNYEGYYQVSNLGRVKSLPKRWSPKENILKPSIEGGGYLQVVLYIDTRKKTIKVHQLVAEAFLGHTRCGFKLVVNHINFDKLDNRVENLEIVTARENCNKKHLSSTSEYVGVYWRKDVSKWCSRIQIDNKNINLGLFDNELEAAKYYKDAVRSASEGKKPKVKRVSYSSKYKGVSWSKGSKKWLVQIRINGKVKHIGLYEDELDAHKAYQDELNKVKQLNK